MGWSASHSVSSRPIHLSCLVWSFFAGQPEPAKPNQTLSCPVPVSNQRPPPRFRFYPAAALRISCLEFKVSSPLQQSKRNPATVSRATRAAAGSCHFHTPRFQPWSSRPTPIIIIPIILLLLSPPLQPQPPSPSSTIVCRPPARQQNHAIDHSPAPGASCVLESRLETDAASLPMAR